MKVFVSHIHEEKKLVETLTKLIAVASLNAIDFFVSSEDNRILGGDEWFDKTRDALSDASLVMVFCSPYSVTKKWVNFEIGGAWMLGKRIIPICYSGLKPSELPKPLERRQGYSLLKKTDLQNLVSQLAKEAKIDTPELDYNRLLDQLTKEISKVQYPSSEPDYLFHRSDYQTQPFLLEIEKKSSQRYLVKDRFSVLTYTPFIVENRRALLNRGTPYTNDLRARIENFSKQNTALYKDMIYVKRVEQYLGNIPHDNIIAVHDPRVRLKHMLRIIFLLRKKKNYQLILLKDRVPFNFIIYDELVMLASPQLTRNMGTRSIVLSGEAAVKQFTERFEEFEAQAVTATKSETIAFLENLCLKNFAEFNAEEHLNNLFKGINKHDVNWLATDEDWDAAKIGYAPL